MVSKQKRAPAAGKRTSTPLARQHATFTARMLHENRVLVLGKRGFVHSETERAGQGNACRRDMGANHAQLSVGKFKAST